MSSAEEQNFEVLRTNQQGVIQMLTFVLWCLLFIFCWPLALLALIAYPIVWLLLLPFRIVGIAVEGVLRLVWEVITLPMRVIRMLFSSPPVRHYRI